ALSSSPTLPLRLCWGREENDFQPQRGCVIYIPEIHQAAATASRLKIQFSFPRVAAEPATLG
ncbi:MAG: hypothetical protein ACR2HX_17225, partial [Pyrinomonadaceae bacterium]